LLSHTCEKATVLLHPFQMRTGQETYHMRTRKRLGLFSP
jgi:ribosomal protein S10